MSEKTKLELHVNPKPFAPAAFDARVRQCIAELHPVIDRLIDRHGAVIVFAGLIEECGDATLGAALRNKVDARAIARIFERLQTSIERVRQAQGMKP